MAQEEKMLLLQDLCARLPYGVRVYGNYSYSDDDKIVDDKRVEILDLSKLDWFLNGIEIKPYLRQMSSMTKIEKEIYKSLKYDIDEDYCEIKQLPLIDWLNTNHFDYRGLIERGLALEAPEGMYNH